MRPWDSYQAYLVDIDGTLLHCRDAVHYFGFCHALELLYGRPLNLDGVVTHGNTDLGIIRDALTLAGMEQEQWRPRLAEAVAAMEGYVAARENEMQVHAIEGARETLAHLQARGAVLSIATGNLKTIGQVKLRLSGFDGFFPIAGYSDGLESREDVFRWALTEIRRLHPDAESVCVIGDTPRDIQAAHENGLAAIAVATGTFSLRDLNASRPDYLVASLSELFD